MTKKRDLERRLLLAGWTCVGGLNQGSKHDKWRKGNRTVMVPRHREIPDRMAKAILKEAGLE